ncbi:MAG: radical SAM protein [Solirubrobacteraceae bacterium]
MANGERLTMPLVVELDPTTFCDLACPECISGELLQQGRFDAERLLALADELIAGGTRAVILIGGGEPLMHPAIGHLIEKLAAGGLDVGLTTNGTQLARYLTPVSQHVAWTRVSVDAATGGTYRALRPHRGGRDIFDDVIANMRLLADKKRGALGFSFLLIARGGQSSAPAISNFAEVVAAAELAKDIGCDYVEVKPEYDLHHYIRRQSMDLLDRLVDDIARIRLLEDHSFRVIAPSHLRDALAGTTKQPKSYDRCHVAELRTLITPSGMYICPYHRGNPNAAFGKPASEPLLDIWQGDERERATAAIRPSRDCGFHCIRDTSNQLIANLGSKPRGSTVPTDDQDLFI